MGWIALTSIWVVFVAGVVLVVLALLRHRRWASSPERLLAERYARGEIDGDEYIERRRNLRQHG